MIGLDVEIDAAKAKWFGGRHSRASRDQGLYASAECDVERLTAFAGHDPGEQVPPRFQFDRTAPSDDGERCCIDP